MDQSRRRKGHRIREPIPYVCGCVVDAHRVVADAVRGLVDVNNQPRRRQAVDTVRSLARSERPHSRLAGSGAHVEPPVAAVVLPVPRFPLRTLRRVVEIGSRRVERRRPSTRGYRPELDQVVDIEVRCEERDRPGEVDAVRRAVVVRARIVA